MHQQILLPLNPFPYQSGDLFSGRTRWLRKSTDLKGYLTISNWGLKIIVQTCEKLVPREKVTNQVSGEFSKGKVYVR